LPSTFVNLDDKEKAFIIAAIKIKMKAEEREIKKAKKGR
jgi:hypothetical protein